jgi:hypothetical protein
MKNLLSLHLLTFCSKKSKYFRVKSYLKIQNFNIFYLIFHLFHPNQYSHHF